MATGLDAQPGIELLRGDVRAAARRHGAMRYDKLMAALL